VTDTAETRPELTVAAVVERRGRFLVVEERVGGRLVLNQPAGHVEAGETLLAAVVREALEETAWTFAPQATVGIYLSHRTTSERRYLRVAFTGLVSRHDASRTLDTGIERTLWLSRAELAAQPARLRSPMVLRAIDDYQRGMRYPLDLCQDLDADALALRAAQL